MTFLLVSNICVGERDAEKRFRGIRAVIKIGFTLKNIKNYLIAFL